MQQSTRLLSLDSILTEWRGVNASCLCPGSAAAVLMKQLLNWVPTHLGQVCLYCCRHHTDQQLLHPAADGCRTSSTSGSSSSGACRHAFCIAATCTAGVCCILLRQVCCYERPLLLVVKRSGKFQHGLAVCQAALVVLLQPLLPQFRTDTATVLLL